MNFKSEQLGTEKISKLLYHLSLPAIAGMVFNALYNFVDAIFIGRGVGRDALGGIAIAFPVQMITISFGFLIGIGSASVISRSLGAGNNEKAKKAVGNAYSAGIVLAILVMVSFLIKLDDLIYLFGATDDIFPYTKDYLSVILLGAVFLILSVITNNIIRSEGNAKMAMITMATGAIVNIILDPIFIYVFKMGIAGAAYATVISQFINFLIGIIYIMGPKTTLSFKLHHMIIDLKHLYEVITIGISAFVRQIAGSAVVVVLNNVIKVNAGDLATLYISSFGIVNRLLMFLFMPMFGINQAFQPIAGYNYGARKIPRVIKLINLTLLVLIIFGSVMMATGQIFARPLISIFVESSETKTIETGISIFRYVILMLPLVGVQVVTATLFQALGRAAPAFFVSTMRQILFLIPLLLILPNYFGITGIWMSYPIADFISITISFILLTKEKKIILNNY